MQTEQSSSINVQRALRLLKRRGPLVLACLLIAGGSAYVFAKRQQKQYTATAALLFQYDSLAVTSAGLSPNAPPINQAVQDTNNQLLLLGPGGVAQKTAQALGPSWTAGRVRAHISATPNSDTQLVNLSATATSPGLARRIANTYAQVFVTEQQALTVGQVTAAARIAQDQYAQMNAAERVSGQGLALYERIQSLETMAKLSNGGVSIASLAALPQSPSSPRVTRNAALGAIIGLLVGLIIAFLLERLDRRVREIEELEAIYGLPVLAAVPERDDYQVLTSLGFGRGGARQSLYDEVFNLLRSYLRYFAVDRELRTLLVVSAGPGEGKTTVSYNLAKAAAGLGQRVLLIEADLRRGTTIAPLLDRPDPALPDVLIGEAGLHEAIRSIQVGPRAVLDVLVAGTPAPPNVGELIESHAMESLLEQVSAEYDLVVVDTPPLAVVADAMPLLSKVDGVLIVGRIGKSRRDSGEELQRKLQSLRVPVLGIVANGVVRSRGAQYGASAYGYSYNAARGPVTPEAMGARRNGTAAAHSLSGELE